MLLTANSTQAYFREALDAAMRISHIHITESAQVYLVYLLHDFARTEKAFAGTDYGQKVSMSELLGRALGSDPHEALAIYRHLGDTSLYLLGFFKTSHAQRIVSKSYYRDMGSLAYWHASHLSRPHAAHSAALFYELSERFSDMVRVIENIASYNDSGKF